MTTWLSQDRRVSGSEAAAAVFAGKDVTSRRGVRDATLEGRIKVGQAREITKLISRLPEDITDAQAQEAEIFLLGKAATTPAKEIPKLRRRVLEAIRPETEDSREAEMARLDAQRRHALSRRHLIFDDDGDGSVVFKGSLPYLEAAPFRKLVDAFVESDRRQQRDRGDTTFITLGQRRADALSAIASNHLAASGLGATLGPQLVGEAVVEAPGETAAETLGEPGVEALGETGVEAPGETGVEAPGEPERAVTGSPSRGADSLAPTSSRSADDPPPTQVSAERVPVPDLSAQEILDAFGPRGRGCGCGSRGGFRVPTLGGERPRVIVTMQEADLRQMAEQAGLLDDDTEISPGELRRLCCDALLLPIVLGTDSEVLDLGREHRLVTPALRRAVIKRDGHCAFPGCRVPSSACEAHHIIPWWRGGTTDLGNLVLLCPHHHGLVEPPRFFTGPPPEKWKVRIGENGLPEFTAPPGQTKHPPIPPDASARPSGQTTQLPIPPAESAQSPGQNKPGHNRPEAAPPPIPPAASARGPAPPGDPPRTEIQHLWPDFDNPGPPPPWADTG